MVKSSDDDDDDDDEVRRGINTKYGTSIIKVRIFVHSLFSKLVLYICLNYAQTCLIFEFGS